MASHALGRTYKWIDSTSTQPVSKLNDKYMDPTIDETLQQEVADMISKRSGTVEQCIRGIRGSF